MASRSFNVQLQSYINYTIDVCITYILHCFCLSGHFLVVCPSLRYININTHTHTHIYIYIYMCVCVCVFMYLFILGTCEGSRFDSNSNRTIPIQFDSDGPIRNFLIEIFTHSSTKNFNRCAVVIESYFMFMIF